MAILWLIRVVRAGRLWYFSVYLIVLGIVVLVVSSRSGGSLDARSPEALDRSTGSRVRDCLLAEVGCEPQGSGSCRARWPATRWPATWRSDPSSDEKSLRVYSWDDLWREIFSRVGAGPSWLSESSARAVFREAVTQVHNQGQIRSLDAVIDWPGYRRRLRHRIRTWTIDEIPPLKRVDGSGDSDPIDAAEWTVYVRYRELLAQIGPRMTRGSRSGLPGTWPRANVKVRRPGRTLRNRGLFSNMKDPRPPRSGCCGMLCGGVVRFTLR